MSLISHDDRQSEPAILIHLYIAVVISTIIDIVTIITPHGSHIGYFDCTGVGVISQDSDELFGKLWTEEYTCMQNEFPNPVARFCLKGKRVQNNISDFHKCNPIVLNNV